MTPPETVNTAPRDPAAASSPIRILLVEDDDGDALLVEELLAVSGAHVAIVRAQTLAEARREKLEQVDCVLLDLDLPDAQGLAALHTLKADRVDLSVLVLTGFDDERRGVAAVAAGAQDYLVKGQIDGHGLARAVRYAVERRRAEETRQQLEVARLHAEENARLERGLLPAPLVSDPALRLSAHYRPGRLRALLGGDFYDAVQDPDGTVHAVIGDVSGHGPDAAALGVCLRIAWRALVLGGSRPEELLPTLQRVHEAERHFSWMFTTLCMATIAPDRGSVAIRLAGHPPPLLIADGRIAALEPAHSEPPLGVVEDATWSALEHPLSGDWSLLLYTDGLIGAARRWQTEYGEPTRELVRRDPQAARGAASVRGGKQRFDEFRAAVARLQSLLIPAREDARDRLDRNADIVLFWVLGTGIVVLLSVAAVAVVLRSKIVNPLQRLAGGVRTVARGDFERVVEGSGAREVVDLAEDVETMRARIVEELAALRDAESDLRRSNAELEQFAYVASHDLQEPLRKVASFCQLLQQRYGGQLDARADQYIGFAVDGALRMQDLINDLLAFSRVGRVENPHTEVDCNALVARVRTDLGRAIEESDATIEASELPTLRGDAGLLRLVFQNLCANAIKFRGEAAPVVRIAASRDGRYWRFRVSDNGIGIDPEYEERIFVLFQRLHPRNQYEGTGIGLAMCRKIVEYHGGRMWLDTEPAAADGGTTFFFTLPAEETET